MIRVPIRQYSTYIQPLRDWWKIINNWLFTGNPTLISKIHLSKIKLYRGLFWDQAEKLEGGNIYFAFRWI